MNTWRKSSGWVINQTGTGSDFCPSREQSKKRCAWNWTMRNDNGKALWHNFCCRAGWMWWEKINNWDFKQEIPKTSKCFLIILHCVRLVMVLKCLGEQRFIVTPAFIWGTLLACKQQAMNIENSIWLAYFIAVIPHFSVNRVGNILFQVYKKRHIDFFATVKFCDNGIEINYFCLIYLYLWLNVLFIYNICSAIDITK